MKTFWEGFEKQAFSFAGSVQSAKNVLKPMANKAMTMARRADVATSPAKNTFMKATQKPASTVASAGQKIKSFGSNMAQSGQKALSKTDTGSLDKAKAYGQRYVGQAASRVGKFVSKNPRSATGLAALGTGVATKKALSGNKEE